MPPDPYSPLEQAASRRYPFGGSAISFPSNLNVQVPGLDPMAQAMGSMFLEPVLAGMLGPGGVPSQFTPTHNLYEHHRKRAQYQAMQASMRDAAALDQAQYVRMIQGTAALAGVQWNDDRQRAAVVMAQDMSSVSPMLAQVMPDTFDRLHGPRGSALMMAGNVFKGARYQADPVTGLLGMSQDSIAQFNKSMYERLYGPGADLSAMRGLGAGRAGELYDEASRRGLMSRALSPEQQREGIARSELGAGATEAQLQKAISDLTASVGTPALEEKVRRFEANRAGDRIKGLAGAVAAMRDLFGENGRPDAPMSMLLEGIQAITQGGLSQMSPERIESVVRDAANTARRTGMGMDQLMMLMANGSPRADALGVSRSFVVPGSLQAAAFGQAYGMLGSAPSWGGADRETLMLKDQQLRLNAAASDVGNQIAATRRIGQEIGFKAGTEAEKLYEAIERGDKTYEWGGVKGKSVFADPGRWSEIVADGGVAAATASAYRSQTAYNQKYLDDKSLALTRSLQGSIDVAPRIQEAYMNAGAASGIKDSAMLRNLGEAMSTGLLKDLPPDDRQNPDKVAKYLAAKLGVDPKDANAMSQLRQAASLGWGNLEQAVKTRSSLRGYDSAGQMIALNHEGTLQAGDLQMWETAKMSALQSAVAGIGGEGIMSRLAEGLANATPNTDLSKLIESALNVTPGTEVHKALEPKVAQMRKEMEILQSRSATPEQRAAAARALSNLKVLGKEVGGLLELEGFELRPKASDNEAVRVWQGLRDKRSSSLSEGDALASKILYDDATMAVLGPGGVDLLTRMQDRSGQLRDLGGADGETLAGRGTLSDEERKRFEFLREEQMRDALDLQTRLRNSKKADLSDEEKQRIDESRKLRTRPGTQVIEDALQSLGIRGGGASTAQERQDLAERYVSGDSGLAIRKAQQALNQLRKIKGGMSEREFQEYLAKGLDDSATPEEKQLYHVLSGGKAGGGLAGLGTMNSRPEALEKAFRDLAPSSVGPGTQSKKTEIIGTLKIDFEGMNGRLAAVTT